MPASSSALRSSTIRPGDRPLLRAYQRGFLASWGGQHRRYRPPAAQPGRPGTRKTLRIGAISPVEDLNQWRKAMFGSDGVQLFQRMAGARECRDRSDRRLPLRSEQFPVQARGREIVTQQGVMIAVATDPAMSEEIARRLNNSDRSDQEDQWAL